jgi:hypothetical protein
VPTTLASLHITPAPEIVTGTALVEHAPRFFAAQKLVQSGTLPACDRKTVDWLQTPACFTEHSQHSPPEMLVAAGVLLQPDA